MKINKTKRFSEKINKIDKPLARLAQEKGEKPQIIKIRNGCRDITTDLTEVERIIKCYRRRGSEEAPHPFQRYEKTVVAFRGREAEEGHLLFIIRPPGLFLVKVFIVKYNIRTEKRIKREALSSEICHQ